MPIAEYSTGWRRLANPPYRLANMARCRDSQWYDAGTNIYLAGPMVFDAAQPHRYGLLWTAGGQWQGGQVCSYIDDQLQGCQPSTAASETGQEFLIVSMGIACNWQIGDRSCIGNLQRADLLVSRITVWGE